MSYRRSIFAFCSAWPPGWRALRSSGQQIAELPPSHQMSRQPRRHATLRCSHRPGVRETRRLKLPPPPLRHDYRGQGNPSRRRGSQVIRSQARHVVH